MTINVTQRHIEEGRRVRACGCPVSLAMSQAIGEMVSVTISTWRRISQLTFHVFPPCASEFIYDFDTGKPVTPFSFEIEL